MLENTSNGSRKARCITTWSWAADFNGNLSANNTWDTSDDRIRFTNAPTFFDSYDVRIALLTTLGLAYRLGSCLWNHFANRIIAGSGSGFWDHLADSIFHRLGTLFADHFTGGVIDLLGSCFLYHLADLIVLSFGSFFANHFASGILNLTSFGLGYHFPDCVVTDSLPSFGHHFANPIFADSGTAFWDTFADRVGNVA